MRWALTDHRAGVDVGQQILQECASLAHGPPPEIAWADLENVEGDVDRRCAKDAALVIPEEMEAAHELFVVHGHLTVQDHDAGANLGDRGR
jgi:hypothetical protein